MRRIDSSPFVVSIPKKIKERFKLQLLVLEDSPRERGSALHGESKGLYRIRFLDKREQVYDSAKSKGFAK